MSHYEERLQEDLAQIHERISAVEDKILRAFDAAVRSLLTDDDALAAEIILGDLPINREIREIDRMTHLFVARHLPSAGHLRFVSSALRLSIALERIGDYAATVAREQVQLSQPPPATVSRDIELITDQALAMLRQANKAFRDGNAELARGTKGLAGSIEGTFQKVFRDLVQEGEAGERPVRDLFALLVVINRVGRVVSQAKNICEEAIFATTGETKEPKVYRILFLDAGNDVASQIAQAYARRAYPRSGLFASAGWAPAQAVDPRCAEAMERRGLDLSGAEPEPLDRYLPELDDYHIVVALAPDARRQLPEVPYDTVLLEWKVPELPADASDDEAASILDATYEQIALKVSDLMDTVRGEEAG